MLSNSIEIKGMCGRAGGPMASDAWKHRGRQGLDPPSRIKVFKMVFNEHRIGAPKLKKKIRACRIRIRSCMKGMWFGPAGYVYIAFCSLIHVTDSAKFMIFRQLLGAIGIMLCFHRYQVPAASCC
jgi:hypothetical protein